MSDNILIDVSTTLENVNVEVVEASAASIGIEYFYPQGPIGPQGPAGQSIWGTISGTLSAQSDLWKYLSAETFSPSQLTAFLNSNAVSLCSINVNGTILSAGTDLFDIFLTPETDSQTLSYTPSSYLLSISNGNTVNLSSINTTFAANSGKYENIYSNVVSNSANWNTAFNRSTVFSSVSSRYDSSSTVVESNSANWNTAFNRSTVFSDISGRYNSSSTVVESNSANWNNAYNTGTVYQANSGSYATYNFVNSNFLNLTGGIIEGNLTLATFTALMNQPPAASFATLDTRNNIAVLDFDDTNVENALFVGIIPEAANLTSGVTVNLDWTATTAVAGSAVWAVLFEKLTNSSLSADSFGPAVSAVTLTSPTSGIPNVTSITTTQINSITAGDLFRLQVQRLGNNVSDDMAGDAELIAIEIRSAA